MASEDLPLRLQQAASRLIAKSKASLNFQVPPLEYDEKLKAYYFLTAPTPLKRLFSSPLAQTGQYAKGPNRERLVMSGWGRPRVFHSGESNISSTHKGLDFRSTIGEQVFACADGVVTFAGYSRRKGGGLNVPGVYANADTRDIYNADGGVIDTKAGIGDAGIYVSVTHNGDFEGYTTQYMHLSRVHVQNGARVKEGDLIGEVGNTAVYSTIHLHFQVKFSPGGRGALVQPSLMVPNYWPGHVDSTSGDLPIPDIRTERPAGNNVVFRAVAGMVQSINRNTSLLNQTGADHKRMQADYQAMAARGINVQQSQAYAALAQAQGHATTVSNPMTFDFTTGLWSDGKPV